MGVEKYKPQTTPHLVNARINRNFTKAERVIRDGRDAVARARTLVEDSHKAIARARQLRRSAGNTHPAK